MEKWNEKKSLYLYKNIIIEIISLDVVGMQRNSTQMTNCLKIGLL